MTEKSFEALPHDREIRFDEVPCLTDLLGQIRGAIEGDPSPETVSELQVAAKSATTFTDGSEHTLACRNPGCSYQCDVNRDDKGVKITSETGAKSRPCVEPSADDATQCLGSLPVTEAR